MSDEKEHIPSESTEDKPIEKGIGVTKSEQHLKHLCEDTFLSLWSYPNVFRDQDNGKEVCDLLVVFGNHIIIFSDKECEFPKTDNLQQDWCRWFKRAIDGSIKQLSGAERWIKQYPDRLFLDQTCTQRFPVTLPDPASAKIHKVIVAHGASERCKKELVGKKRGSLILIPSIIGSQHYDATSTTDLKPFAIGQLAPGCGFLHVLDDTSLDLVLKTVDTISDFTDYLEKKEEFITSGQLGFAAGEEELLAFYCANYNPLEGHSFGGKENFVMIEEGFWDDYISSPEWVSQNEANKISYKWDTLIDLVGNHVLGKTLHHSSDTEFALHERRLRVMAQEPRTRRRALSIAMTEICESEFKEGFSVRTIAPGKEGTSYVFMIMARSEPLTSYRQTRQDYLAAYCMRAKLEYPDASDILGIAFDTKDSLIQSEDICSIRSDTWTVEHQKKQKK